MPKCPHYPGVHSQTTYFIHKETREDIFNGNKMFQWYLNYGNITVIYHDILEKSVQAIK